MNIIVVAMREEYDQVVAQFGKGLKILNGTVEGTMYDQMGVFLSGVGKVNAAKNTAYLLSRFNVNHLISVGYAAGTTNHTIGQVTFPHSVRVYDMVTPVEVHLEESRYLQDGDCNVCLTGDRFVSAVDVKALKLIHPLPKGSEHIFDMELGAIAAVAEDFGVPLFAYKVISDIPENHPESSYEEFMKSLHDPLISFEGLPKWYNDYQ